MATALADLGVAARSIDGETRSRLDRDGYAPLPGVLSAAQLAVIRARLGELLAAEGDRAGLEVHQEEGTDRLADLVNKDPAFEVCFTDPRLLACVAHVLGEFKLFSLNFRAALLGQGLQALHTEGGPVTDSAAFQVCNSIWLLDDFTADNGATRVVPGSHLSGRSPGDVMADRRDSHPGEVLLLAPVRTWPLVLRGKPGRVRVGAAGQAGDLLVAGAGRRGPLWRLTGFRVSPSCLHHAQCPVRSCRPPLPPSWPVAGPGQCSAGAASRRRAGHAPAGASLGLRGATMTGTVRISPGCSGHPIMTSRPLFR